jgi:hypothetical protein
MALKLITEVVEQVKYLTEETKDGKKNYFLEGIFLQSEMKNRNGRVYPKSVLAREVGRYMKENVITKRAFGELGHPDSPTINLDRVSHMIVDLKEDGNNFVGKAKILDTPFGKIVKSLMDEGATLGVSSRGMGSLKTIKEGSVQLVQDDYYLATAADIVADPSAPDAFVRGVMESKEWVFDASSGNFRLIQDIQEEVRRAKTKQLEEVSIKVFEKFLGSL